MSHRSTHGASAVQYSLFVVVIGASLAATVGFGRVVLASFVHTTSCYAVATCEADAASTEPAPFVDPVQTVDALGNPITVGCVVESASADHGCGRDTDGDPGRNDGDADDAPTAAP